MSTTKVINHLSVDNLNLNEVLSQQDKFFVNDDLILILLCCFPNNWKIFVIY